jgi:hypothetical protein
MDTISINLSAWDEPGDLDTLADAFQISADEPGEDDEAARAAVAKDVTPAEPEDGLADALDPGAVRPEDPAEIGYPPTLPIEVALQTAPEDTIREAYGFSPAQWSALMRSTPFRRDLDNAREMLRTEGMSFKAKARLQAEELLATSWQMIHDAKLPATVRADLLKFTVRAAGLEAKSSEDSKEGVTPLKININL